MPEQPRHAAIARYRIPLLLASALAVAGGTAGCAAAGHAGSAGQAGTATAATGCPAAMAFWRPRVVTALHDIGTDSGNARHASATSGASAASESGFYLAMLGPVAALALREDLPPACEPQLRASFRASMTDFVRASRDETKRDLRGAMTELNAGTVAERKVTAALTTRS